MGENDAGHFYVWLGPGAGGSEEEVACLPVSTVLIGQVCGIDRVAHLTPSTRLYRSIAYTTTCSTSNSPFSMTTMSPSGVNASG